MAVKTLLDYPRYQIGERKAWNDALTQMWRDLWNSVGHPIGNNSGGGGGAEPRGSDELSYPVTDPPE